MSSMAVKSASGAASPRGSTATGCPGRDGNSRSGFLSRSQGSRHVGRCSERLRPDQHVEKAQTGGVSQPVRRVGPEDLTDADPTPGMRRQVAFTAPGLWAGLVHTDVGAASGWHHHGEYETSLYVVRGRLRIEFGAAGAQSVEAGPGEFLHVPARTVHRELNPDETSST